MKKMILMSTMLATPFLFANANLSTEELSCREQIELTQELRKEKHQDRRDRTLSLQKRRNPKPQKGDKFLKQVLDSVKFLGDKIADGAIFVGAQAIYGVERGVAAADNISAMPIKSLSDHNLIKLIEQSEDLVEKDGKKAKIGGVLKRSADRFRKQAENQNISNMEFAQMIMVLNENGSLCQFRKASQQKRLDQLTKVEAISEEQSTIKESELSFDELFEQRFPAAISK